MKLLEYTGKAWFPLTIPGGSTPRVTRAQAVAIAGEDALRSGELRFKTDTRYPWGVTTRIVGAVVRTLWDPKAPKGCAWSVGHVFYGMRAGVDCREAGYVMECRVSIGGRKVSAFTSDILLEIVDPRPGDRRLVSVATLFPRLKD